MVCEQFLIAISEEVLMRYSAKCEEFTRRTKEKKKKQTIVPDEEQNKLANALSTICEIVLKELASRLSLIVDELVNKTKDKKEDSDWEGF